MPLKLEKFAVDKKKEVEGVWEDLGDGAGLLIARMGNKRFAEGYAAIPRGTRRMIESDKLSDDAVDDIICKLLAETILLDWKGVEEGGKEVPYSKETAADFLKRYPDFRQMVWTISEEQNRFHQDSIEDDAKNSKSVSGGN